MDYYYMKYMGHRNNIGFRIHGRCGGDFVYDIIESMVIHET